MTTYRRCPACAHFYEKDLGPCPECDEPPARPNKWLRTASLNKPLYEMAEASKPENQFKQLHKQFKSDIKKVVAEA